MLADGTVQVNTNSEAYYLNDDRYGDVKVPDGLGAQPQVEDASSRSGRFEWHDHRMHWMSQGTPPQVTDQDERTHIFDWKVPITVGGRRARSPARWTGCRCPGGSVPLRADLGLGAAS